MSLPSLGNIPFIFHSGKCIFVIALSGKIPLIFLLGKCIYSNTLSVPIILEMCLCHWGIYLLFSTRENLFIGKPYQGNRVPFIFHSEKCTYIIDRSGEYILNFPLRKVYSIYIINFSGIIHFVFLSGKCNTLLGEVNTSYSPFGEMYLHYYPLWKIYLLFSFRENVFI